MSLSSGPDAECRRTDDCTYRFLRFVRILVADDLFLDLRNVRSPSHSLHFAAPY